MRRAAKSRRSLELEPPPSLKRATRESSSAVRLGGATPPRGRPSGRRRARRDEKEIFFFPRLGRKTATILEAVRRKCEDHRRDRDRILAESAASVAAATREALAEHDKFDGLQALALGAIESAQARAEASCQALRNENAALREELQSVVRRGVSDLANSGSRSDLACAAAAGPFRKPGQVTSSESSRGGGSGTSGRAETRLRDA